MKVNNLNYYTDAEIAEILANEECTVKLTDKVTDYLDESGIEYEEDYSQFEITQEVNRVVYRINVKNLCDAFFKHGFQPDHCIHVIRNERGKLQPLSGQHRLLALVLGGYPVFYKVIEDLCVIKRNSDGNECRLKSVTANKLAQVVGTAKAWVLGDNLFQQRNSSDISSAISKINGKVGSGLLLDTLKFSGLISPEVKSKQLDDLESILMDESRLQVLHKAVLQWTEMIEEYQGAVAKNPTLGMKKAMMLIQYSDHYEHGTMLELLANHSSSLESASAKFVDCSRSLCEAYNKGRPDKQTIHMYARRKWTSIKDLFPVGIKKVESFVPRYEM